MVSLMNEEVGDAKREWGREVLSQPIEPIRDEVSDKDGREFHPMPSWSVAAVP